MSSAPQSIPSRLGDRPIAIIGMSALFPQAENIGQYWNNIVEQIDSIIEIPESRWSIEDYFDLDQNAPDKSYSKHGGFLPDVDFNPMDFGIPPNILEVTDSSQLLGLLTAKNALQDGGYGEASEELLDRTGVILGVTAGMKLMGSLTARLQYPIWERVLRRSGFSENETRRLIERMKKAYVRWEENSFPGLLGNVIAGRIANRLNLGGTNCTVDAACASSLSAMKMAISDLNEHRANMMITGGVDSDNSPFMYMCFSKTPAFTADEKVKPFDADSKGIMIGEGLGMVILKRLEDAERDGDRIYSVIRGIGTSSDGRFKSIYAPRSSGQAKALRRAYQDAGFAPESVGLIEAHGTGTTAGDLAEFEGLKEVFAENNNKKQHIALGSVKSQIGHTKAAAGIAGLIKTSLALHHKVLPPTINIETPNPKLGIEETPFYLNTESRPWASTGLPRRAGISSFGFGGTNFHFVLEEHDSANSPEQRLIETPEMILLNAKDPEQLKALCQEEFEKSESDVSHQRFQELIHQSLENEIPQENARLGFLCNSTVEVGEKLKQALEIFTDQEGSEEWSKNGIFYASKGKSHQGSVVALFSGQGSQYRNMGKELYLNFPPMLESLQSVDQRFIEEGSTPLSSVVFPKPVFDQQEQEKQESELQLTQHAQPSIGAFGSGLYRILKDCGFEANFTAGHSFGELTAIWAAGVLKDKDYYHLAHARGQAMAAPDDPDFDAGAMLAVMGKVDQLEQELSAFPDVKLANLNSKKQVVLAGPKADIEKAREHLKSKKFTVVPLPVSAAFHTPLVGHAQKPFAQAIQSVEFKKPSVPVYSNATAKAYPKKPETIKTQLEEHILQSVRFCDEIEQIHQDGGRIFIEFGPKNVLTKLTDNILSGKDYFAVALNDSPKKNSDLLFREAILKLCVAGLPLQKFDRWRRTRNNIEQKKSPLTISLNGANYVSSETKLAFEQALKEGNIKESSHQLPKISVPVVQKTTEADIKPTVAVDSFNSIKQPKIPITMNSVKKSDSPALQENNGAPMDQNLERYFQQQNDTLQVHRQYLEQQSEYSRTVLQLMQQQLNMAAQGQTLPDSVNQHLEMFHEHQGQTLRIHEQYLIQQTSQMQSGTTVNNGTRVQQEIRPTATLSPQIQSATNPSPPSTPAPVSSAVSPSPQRQEIQTVSKTAVESTSSEVKTDDLTAKVLNIVSEKTGYPTEMLEMSMDMEADLGIDSIKRVEILGSLQDQLPGLPELKGEDLAELRTLGQILEHLQTLVGDTEIPAAPDASTAAKPDQQVSQNSDTLQQTMFRIVSDKTGYPVEMLDQSMDMEADLGIDSIKRVEILGSLQDLLPGFPEIRGEDLAELRSLGQILNHLQTLVPSEESVSTEIPSKSVDYDGTSSPNSSSSSDPAKALLTVISEKTGYPAEMLDLSMDMEADLGIDSIKRVEIMWALQERFPELPQIGGSELGELRTLQQIVEFLVQLLEGGGNGHDKAPLQQETTPAASPASPGNGNGSASQSSGIGETLLAIIGEKTGYPPEMLEMSMDLEADLGIDSIKRVEIMWAFQEKFPELPQISNSEMGELRTLQQISDHLNELASQSDSVNLTPEVIQSAENQETEKKKL